MIEEDRYCVDISNQLLEKCYIIINNGAAKFE